MKNLLDTRVKPITTGIIVVALVIGSGVGVWTLTNKGNAIEDTPIVELTDVEKDQLEKEEKFNDFLIAEGDIKIVEGTLDFDFSKVIQPKVDKGEVEGFDFNKLGVQEGTITASVGTKKLSKPLIIEVIAKEYAAEATKVTEVKFDEAKVKEVETGKVVSKDVADKVKPTTPNNNGNGGTVTKPTEPTEPEKPVEKPVVPSKPKPAVTTKEETKTESIGYTTEYRDDSTMLKGQTKVIQSGANGVRTIVYTVTLADGKETDRVVKSNTITTNPTVEIIARGTKEEVIVPTLNFSASNAGYFTTYDAANAKGDAYADVHYRDYDRHAVASIRASDGIYYYALFIQDYNGQAMGSKGWSGTRTFTVNGTTVTPN